MAYDSATAVTQASNAYKRAMAAAQQKRASLNSSYGLNSDGSMDNSAAGRLGSLYQGNLDSVMSAEGAEVADRRRGFRGTGGLAGKNQARADLGAQTRQAVGFREANTRLGENTQESQFAEQEYRDQVGADGLGGIIGRNAAWDLAQNIVANPVLGSAPVNASTPFNPAPTPAHQAAMRLTGTKTAAAAIKKQPNIFQVVKNNRF